MTKVALQTLGWLLARTPEPVLRVVAWALAGLVYLALGPRRRLIHANLHHAFPDRPAAWRSATAREVVRRFTETGLLSLATPYLSADRFRRIVRAGPGFREAFARHRADPRPTLLCAPHFAYWEVLTAMPLLEQPFPELGAIFRPLDNPAADAFIKGSRERFGIRLLSRRDGFQEAIRILRRSGWVGILHDQNAGTQGALTLLFDRVCSSTELPGMLASKFGARVLSLHARRLGFWRVELVMEPVEHDGTTDGVTIALNRWLEDRLRVDDELCASWLWGHQRWKTQDGPAARFRLEQKRDLLAADRQRRGLAALPRRTRLWIRMPNWLGDVVMALPLIRALRRARPDMELTLLAKPAQVAWLEGLGVADRIRPLPPGKGLAYLAAFRRARDEFPDCHLLFTNSTRGDLEAWLAGARQRFGIRRAGHPRPLLTHRFKPAPDHDEARQHQLDLWTDLLRHFGLKEAPDRTPFPRADGAAPRAAIGLICGSENTPEKRWPVAHWRALVEALPQESFVLFGTARDREITTAVAAGFGARVEDLAGRTGLDEFARRLASCRLLVANDTGGMHLANALGVPVIGLFGPTNPVRTRPVFDAPVAVLQPPGCPPTGGAALRDLAPETVVAKVREQLHASC